MFAGHPILEEIKQGIKLRPTKTIDKSKPLFKADGEDESSIDPKRRAPDGVPPAPVFAPPPPCTAPPPPPINFPPGAPPPPPPPGMNRAKSPGGFKLGGSTPAEVDRNALLKGIQGGVRLRKTVTNDKSGLVVDDELKQKSVKIHDPVPNAPPPPPPPMSAPSAPPPPPPANLTKPNTERAKSPRVFKLGGSTPAEVDRNALLQGIQGGFRLRKTVTNDKSGLVIDEDMLKSSFKRCEPTAPPPMPVPKAVPTITRNKSPNNLAVESSEDERYQTPDDRGAGSKYATPEPGDFSPPTPRRQTATPEPQAPKKIDYTFEEKNLKVTSEDLEKEIKKGTAAAKIAKFMQAESSAPGGSTLPKANFRRSPLRSTFLEVNNNQNDDSQKSKPVSKWAPVEVGGLKRPSQGNTPMEKIERAHSESRFPTRERSASALAEPVSTERARTQSPIGERERSSSTLPAPISIRTDFNDTSSKTTSSKRTVGKLVRPQIEETPPTPKTSTAHSHPYTFKPPRSVSPPEQPTSPISSISSASLPSPSSISPGSTSPEVVPRRRVNPAFDKAKEKFASAPTQPSTSAPAKTTKTLKPSTVESKNAATSPMPSPSVQKTEKKDPVKKTVKETQTSTKYEEYERPKRVINIPINAPWHNRRDYSTDTTRVIHIGMDPFATMSPSELNRNFRFDINLASDSPLSIINR